MRHERHYDLRWLRRIPAPYRKRAIIPSGDELQPRPLPRRCELSHKRRSRSPEPARLKEVKGKQRKDLERGAFGFESRSHRPMSKMRPSSRMNRKYRSVRFR